MNGPLQIQPWRREWRLTNIQYYEKKTIWITEIVEKSKGFGFIQNNGIVWLIFNIEYSVEIKLNLSNLRFYEYAKRNL